MFHLNKIGNISRTQKKHNQRNGIGKTSEENKVKERKPKSKQTDKQKGKK
jgi:hypothetical protein